MWYDPRMTVGPPVGAGCATCQHPDAEQINALINQGRTSSRKIARMYGLAKDTVARHAFKRHPGVIPVGSAAEPEDDGDDPKTELERLDDIRVALEAEMRRAPRADLSRELRQVNGRIAEIRGTDRPKEMRVEDVQGLPEQIKRWFEALEPYPDAREAMFLATDPKLLEAAGVE